MSIKRDSYISKPWNLTHIRLEAVNSSRISTDRSYPEYKTVILKLTSPIPAGLPRSPSFSASSLLLSFRYGKGTGNRSREKQVLKKFSFYLSVRKMKNIASSLPQNVTNNCEEVEVGLREYSFLIWTPNGR
jgi:hypothetical protein